MTTNSKEIGISVLKTLFGAIPYVGTALDEVIFENRSRIKQDRLNRFSELLQEYFQEQAINDDELMNLKSEDFSDIFESVLQRVVLTKNQKKLERFRNILVGQIKGTEKSDFIESYLDITSRLNDMQILILEKFAKTKRTLNAIEEEKDKLKVKIREAEDLLDELKNKAKDGTIQPGESIAEADRNVALATLNKLRIEKEKQIIEEIKTPGYYNLNEVDFEFYLQDMVSKSLLKNVPVTLQDNTTIVLKEITEFGMRYFEFLNHN
jgi:hypothetical protein